MDLILVAVHECIDEGFPGVERGKDPQGVADALLIGERAGLPDPGAGKLVVFRRDKEFRAAETREDVDAVFPCAADDVVGDAPVILSAFLFGPPPEEDAVVVQPDRSESACAGPGEEFIQRHAACAEQRLFRQSVRIVLLKTGCGNVEQMSVHAGGKSVAERIGADRQFSEHREQQRKGSRIGPQFERSEPVQIRRERELRALPRFQTEGKRDKRIRRFVKAIIQRGRDPADHRLRRMVHRLQDKAVLSRIADRIGALECGLQLGARRIGSGCFREAQRVQMQIFRVPDQSQKPIRIALRNRGRSEGILLPFRGGPEESGTVPPVMSLRVIGAGAEKKQDFRGPVRFHPAGEGIAFTGDKRDVVGGKLQGLFSRIRKKETVLAVHACGGITNSLFRREIRGGIGDSRGQGVIGPSQFETGVAQQIAPLPPGEERGRKQETGKKKISHGGAPCQRRHSSSGSFRISSLCPAGTEKPIERRRRLWCGYLLSPG